MTSRMTGKTARVARALLVAAWVIAIAPAPEAQGKSEHWKRLPAPIAQVVQQNRPGADIDKLDIEKEHGISVYDIEFAGGQGEMDIAEDGTVLDIATVVIMKDVPEAAAAAIRSVVKTKAIKQLTRSEVRAEIVSDGGKAHISKLATPRYVYEAEFPGGEVEVTAEGKILKVGK